MDKQGLQRSMERMFGSGLISQKQVGQFRGDKDPETTKKFVKGIEYATSGKKKLYYTGDIAARIMETRVGG